MILGVSDLRLRRGTREVLRGVSFAAARGEIVALMGASGAGKTTVLRAITALEPFHAGSIEVGGVMLRAGALPPRRTTADLRRQVGIVFQFHYLFEHLSAIDNVTLAPRHVTGESRSAAEGRAVALLDSLGVAHRRNAYPRELSGGEAQRVAIARAMAMDPPLLLMDEPTASLDPPRRIELGESLVRLAREGRTLVLSTHDDDFAREFADRAVVLEEGEVVQEGRARDILTARRPPPTE